MTDSSEASTKGDQFRELLERLVEQADDMIADFRAQDPATIDLVGLVGSLPGKVLDELVDMKDKLSVESRAALDEWGEETGRRRQEMFGCYEEQSPLHQAVRERQGRQDELTRPMREWHEQQSAARGQRWEWDQLKHPYNRAITDYLQEREEGATSLVWDEWQQQHRHFQDMIDWQEAQRTRDHELWRQYEESEHASFRDSLPPNWNNPEVEFPGLEELEVLQLTEGLPLAWVPPNHVLREVLSCRTSAARRRVIANESTAILAACLRELRLLRSPETSEWRASARQAAQAMKANHWRAGQALAAITLDTATDKFVRSSYRDATKQSRNGKGKIKVATPPGSSEDSLPTWRDVDYPRALLVLHSLYGAFSEFDLRSGEPVPTQFTRHGTVHTVSRRQYGIANALIALMHVVGLLCLIEDE